MWFFPSVVLFVILWFCASAKMIRLLQVKTIMFFDGPCVAKLHFDIVRSKAKVKVKVMQKYRNRFAAVTPPHIVRFTTIFQFRRWVYIIIFTIKMVVQFKKIVK